MAAGNIMEDVRAFSQPVSQFPHQGTGIFQASLVFEPLSDDKTGDFRHRASPCLSYHCQLLILLGRQLKLNGDCGHKLISLWFETEMTKVWISRFLRRIVTQRNMLDKVGKFSLSSLPTSLYRRKRANDRYETWQAPPIEERLINCKEAYHQ